jgi:hypothetical protein
MLATVDHPAGTAPAMPPKRSTADTPPNRKAGARRRGRLTDADLAFVKRHFGLRPETWIASELGRTVEQVRAAALEIFQNKARRGPWAEEEVEKLKEYIGAAEPETIARVLGRPAADVERQIGRLAAVRRTGRWTSDEIQRLKRLFGTRTDEDLARILGRPVEAIRRQAAKLALAKDKAFVRRLEGAPATRMPRWSKEQLELLARLYPTHANLEIARTLERSVKSVVSKAHQLGLEKSPVRLREMGRENVRRRYAGA